jgi:NodT family efflux transporter outer membrane factor (OMF) lipoprotein
MTLLGRAAAGLALVALAAGCAVGPDYRRPAAPVAERYTRAPLPDQTASANIPGGEAQRFLPEQDVPHDWWTLFKSPALNALVEQALRASPTLIGAQEAVAQANALVAAQRGFFVPTVQASFSPSRQSASATIGPPTGSSFPIRRPPPGSNDAIGPGTLNPTYNLYTAQVTVGYTPDVFGANRRQVESLIGQVDAQRFQLEAARVTLATNVVAAAVQEASLHAQIEATREIISISAKSVELVRRQFGLGAVSGLDVAAQETALAQAEQTLPGLQKQLEQNRDLLTALLGRLPSDDPPEAFNLDSFKLPIELPLSLPSKLVEQRPDVRAAEAQLHAASAQVGVAVASRLPEFTITATAGGTSTSIAQMFSNGNPFWSIAGVLSHTVFDGFTMLFRQRAAEAAFEQAAAQYRTTVITGYQNVADVLYALQADAQSLKGAVAAERAAKRTLDITVKQQELGAVNYLVLLSARQAYLQTLIASVQSTANRLSDTAALFQALGGGWWNRAPAAQTSQVEGR